ncbi:MAG TPA: methylated-DNA--[protein]-cysteine S-methyltransferase [Chloroflexia bacterium]
MLSHNGGETLADIEVVVGEVETPAGEFGAVLTSRGLSRLIFPGEDFAQCEDWVTRWAPAAARSGDRAGLQHLGEQLTAYFEGTLREFTVPLDLRGTPFQLRVWAALQEVAYGELRTYGQVASGMGATQAVRAVGAANGANPVPIIVPCHRIIGSNGRLVGYGGGLDLKRRLLELEGVMSAFEPSLPLAPRARSLSSARTL